MGVLGTVPQSGGVQESMALEPYTSDTQPSEGSRRKERPLTLDHPLTEPRKRDAKALYHWKKPPISTGFSAPGVRVHQILNLSGCLSP